MAYHPVVSQIRALLDTAGIVYETFEHTPVRTSEEAAAVRHGYGLEHGAKALILKAKKPEGEYFVMVVIPGDQRFDGKKVKQAISARDVTFATPEEVATLTGGVEVGGVPPFGNLFHLAVYADQNMLTMEKIVFNAGDRSFSIAMKSVDWQRLVSPRIGTLV